LAVDDGHLDNLRDNGTKALLKRDSAPSAFTQRAPPIGSLCCLSQHGKLARLVAKSRSAVFVRVLLGRDRHFVKERLREEAVL